MAILGLRDLKNTGVPTLWDTSEILKSRLADGRSFEQVLGELRVAIPALNAGLASMPLYSGMLAMQDSPDVEYVIGASNGVDDATEYSPPTPKQGATSGHMIPLNPYSRALGWTLMSIRKTRSAQFEADIRSAISDVKSHWQQNLLTRFFKIEGEKVGSVTNASVPFADAAATATDYVPPQSPTGEEFASSHTHFLRHTAIDATNVTAAVKHLFEHGHLSPYDLVASNADVGTWTGLTTGTVTWKKPDWPEIAFGSSSDLARTTVNVPYAGFLDTPYGVCRVWFSPRVPTNYYGLYKSYGTADQRNPLRVRFDRNVGLGWQLLPGMHVLAPQLLAVMYSEFGVGVGQDRTNGVCVYIAGAGNYTTPTIS